jgi:hypothetical protein
MRFFFCENETPKNPKKIISLICGNLRNLRIEKSGSSFNEKLSTSASQPTK